MVDIFAGIFWRLFFYRPTDIHLVSYILVADNHRHRVFLLPHYRQVLKKYIICGGAILLLIGRVWWGKFHNIEFNSYAFVVEGVIDVKFASSVEATTYFKVYEGTKVAVIREEGKWLRIKTSDGKIGWALCFALNKI